MENNQLLQKISTDLDILKTDVQTLKGDTNGLKTDTQEVKQNTTDILEIVNFIQENAVTKEEFEQKTAKMDQAITKIGSTMANKDFVTEKLSDLQGNIVVLMRKEDTKLKALVDILEEKQVLNQEDKKRIFSMEPFPQIF